MATQCTNCGQPLPKDDARFCSNCGTLVPSHPFSPQSLSSSKNPPGDQAKQGKAPLREQIAQQPPPRPSHRALPDEPPDWMTRLDSVERGKQAPKEIKAKQAEQSPTKAHIDQIANLPTMSWPSVTPSQAEPLAEPEAPPDLVSPTPLASKPPSPKTRELHVKVWEQEEPLAPLTNKEEKTAMVEDDVEDLPTGPLRAEHPQKQDPLPPPILGVQTPHFPAVTELDTIPMATPRQIQPVLQPTEERTSRPTPPYAHAARPPLREMPNQPAAPTAQRQIATQQPSAPVPPLLKRPKRRAPLLITVILLCLLIFGGVATWIIVFQPFSVPQVTQPLQHYQNTSLGFSLQYPTGWTAQEDQTNNTVNFSDSSHTAQFSVLAVAANGQNTAQYLLKVATQLNLTAPKPETPLSFGGTTWQRVQGTILQEGTNYIAVILVTMHGDHLFSLIEQAPQGPATQTPLSLFDQEDQIVFASARSSFQFLS